MGSFNLGTFDQQTSIMKRSIQLSFLSFFLFSSFISFSQKKFTDSDHENFFRFGAKGGININKIQGESYKSGFSYNYLLGGFFQFNFGRFGFQPEINLVQSSSEFTNSSADVYNDLFYNGSQRKATLNYIKVPLLLNINVGESKHVKLQIGPQFGGLLKQTVDSLRADKNVFKTSDFSAVGGLWIQIPFINFGARYELGLSNVNDIDKQQKWKSQAFTIFVGFTF